MACIGKHTNQIKYKSNCCINWKNCESTYSYLLIGIGSSPRSVETQKKKKDRREGICGGKCCIHIREKFPFNINN